MPVPDEDSPSATPRFPTYTPSSGSISADGAALTATAGSPESVADTVAGRHNAAVQGVSGMVQNSMAGQDQAAKDMAIAVSQRAISGGSSLSRFAGFVREHDARVSQWNGQIAAEPDAEAQQACYNRLSPSHADSLEELRTGAKATQIARYLRQPLDIETIRSLFTAGAMPAATPSIFPGVGLDGHDQMDAINAKIANGQMPPLDQLSEAERLQLLEDFPDVVDYLVALPHPSQTDIDTVINLVLPRVNGEDAEDDADDVLAALDGELSPSAFRDAVANMGALGTALTVFAPWAKKHGLEVPEAQRDYLRTFVDRTGPRSTELLDYLAREEHVFETGETRTVHAPGGDYETPITETMAGFSDAAQDAFRRQYANGVLALSDHSLGGGWDQLPEEMRSNLQQLPVGNGPGGDYYRSNDDFKALAGMLSEGDIAGGDELSEQLAVTTQRSIAYADQEDRDWGDDLGGDVLELVSRNHQATTNLLAGGEHMPEGYDQGEFLSTVYGHDWDDDGAAAASLTDWIHEQHDPERPGPDRELADEAFNGLAEGLTSVGDDGIFREMMGPDGDSALAVNPALGRSLVDATSDHLDGFSAQEGTDGSSPVSEVDRVRLMTLMASDPGTADRLTASVIAHQSDELTAWAENSDRPDLIEVADRNSRLSTYLDSALVNEASERGLSEQEAENERVARIKAGLGIVSTVAGLGPTGTGTVAGAANSVLANVLTPENLPAPAPSLDPDWTAQGGHVTTANGLQLVRALEQAGVIEGSDVPDDLVDPTGTSDAAVTSSVQQVLADAFPDRPGLYSDFVQEVQTSYIADLGNLSVRGAGDERIAEFLESDSWPS